MKNQQLSYCWEIIDISSKICAFDLCVDLPRHVMFYDVVEFVYSHKMSPALCRELPKLLAPPVNHVVHMEHIRILSQYRYISDITVYSVCLLCALYIIFTFSLGYVLYII